MSRIVIFVTILLCATSVYSKGVGNTVAIQATTYADGILFEAVDNAVDFKLNVIGTGNSAFAKQYSSSGPIFINANNEDGVPLPDGLYKYEAQLNPAFTISRQESSKLPDRNVLKGKSDPKSSPISGNFRILDGMVVDPLFEEFDAVPVGGAE